MLIRAACLPVIVFVFSTLIVGPVYGATVEEFGIRITKDVTPTSVCPGDDVTVTLRIESTDQAQAVPVDVVIALDRSLSMQGEKLQDAKNAAKQFVDQLSVPEDQVALVSFSDTATLDKGLSTDVAGVKAAIDGMTAGNLTAIGEAINVARAEALGPSHRDFNVPTIVLLSDGQNTAGVDPGQPAEAAKNAGVRMISIGLGGGGEEAALTSAASSESDYYFAPTSTVLSAIYADIVQSFEALVTTNAAVVDVVPGHATYVQGSASRPPDVGGKTLTWDIGTLDSAEAWVVNWRQTMAAEGLVDDLTSRF
ncbi:MAG: VWA domain-containing protein, partial [Terriglobia bacterium]